MHAATISRVHRAFFRFMNRIPSQDQLLVSDKSRQRAYDFKSTFKASDFSQETAPC